MDYHFHSNLNRLLLCYLLGYSILGVYGCRLHVNDAWKTDTFVNSPKGEKVRWQINQYSSPDSLRRRRSKSSNGLDECMGRLQRRLFPEDNQELDALVWTEPDKGRSRDIFTGFFQGAHGWNYFNEADHSRLSWHLSSMLVNGVSWLDSCMGSSHDCSRLLEGAKVRTVLRSITKPNLSTLKMSPFR